MTVPAYDHIVVVVMENYDYGQIIGNGREAPYINALASSGALMANYRAIAHPSEPNYFVLYAGSTFGIADDRIYRKPDPTLATILQGAGKTFTGYVESIGRSYDHNPWESFPEGFTVEKDFSKFPKSDFASLSQVSFVIPNVQHDRHDGTIGQGDKWLKINLDGYARWAAGNNSLLVVVWDESAGDATNHVPAILYGDHVSVGTYTHRWNHYNLLSTILAPFKLSGPNDAADALPIEVFGEAGSRSCGSLDPVGPDTADNSARPAR